MEKVILIVWIIWICWATEQASYIRGGIWELMKILAILSGTVGVIWILFFWKCNVVEPWPLTLVETIVALASFSLRPIWVIRGLRRSAYQYEVCRAEREREHPLRIDSTEIWARPEVAISRLLFGTETLLPRTIVLVLILSTVGLRQGFPFTVTFVCLYTVLFFVWIFTAVGSTVTSVWGWTFRSLSYGDSGYGDLGKYRNFVFLGGETILPVLIWVTILIEPIRSFLTSKIQFHT